MRHRKTRFDNAEIEEERLFKWNLLFGIFTAPTTVIVLGRFSDLNASIGLAGLVLLIYALLYNVLD